jgi:light-regulated signal transduction histidine kinase (bacteriophytochrome)
MQWGAMAEIDRLTRRDTIRGVRLQLGEQLRDNDSRSVAEALTHGPLTMTDLVQADGAAIRVGGQTAVVGDTPEPAGIGEFVDRLRSAGETPFMSEALAVDRPDLSALLPSVAGAVVIPFGASGDYLAWFRREIVQTVEWLGDQSPANRATRLSPRNSFATWSESVSGKSLPWDELELLEAAEFCRDLNTVLLNLAEVQLATLRALTGP